LYDDGTHGDQTASDSLFSLEIPIETVFPVLNLHFSIIAEDQNGMVSSRWPNVKTY
jgi:hypothetical protein